MSHEPLENIFFTCPKHASKPDPRFAQMLVTSFIGKYVKKSFPEKNSKRDEHLWVKITKVKDRGTLIGNIANDPVLNIGYKDGDEVEVKTCDIEELYSD